MFRRKHRNKKLKVKSWKEKSFQLLTLYHVIANRVLCGEAVSFLLSGRLLRGKTPLATTLVFT